MKIQAFMLLAIAGPLLLVFGEPDPNEMCRRCRDRRNTRDIYADPDDCHFFYQCFFANENSAIGIRRQCPPGQFFNEYVLTCVAESATAPCGDYCRNDTIAAIGCYAAPNNCASYFVCSNGASYPFCCPAGTQINAENCICEESTTCTDVCTPLAAPSTTVRPPTSNETHCADPYGNILQAVPDQPGLYYVFGSENDDGNIPQHIGNCAPGTTFTLADCACTGLVDVVNAPSSRQCYVYMPFDTDMADLSIHQFPADVVGNAQIDRNSPARGTGSLHVNQGHVEIAGLKGVDFARHGTWCLFFRCQSNSTAEPYTCQRPGGLLSNSGGHSGDYSIIMSANSNQITKSRIDAQLNLVAPIGSTSVSYPTTAANGFNQACVTYDGTTASLYINGELVQPCAECVKTSNGGALAISQCPYTIGSDQTLGNFTGNIDEVLICPTALTPVEVNAHYRGDYAFLISQGLLPQRGKK